MKLALAQLNLTVGDLAGNVAAMKRVVNEARSERADLIAFPELATTGYPPEDLLLKPSFVAENLAAIEDLATAADGITLVAGFVSAKAGQLGNAAAVCANGQIAATYTKQLLPNYGVFDEDRWFSPGSAPLVIDVAGSRVGVTICEDAWESGGPVMRSAEAGADLIVNINASPFHRGKERERREMLADRASETGAVIAYVNLVGGQDELVFDGSSMVLAPELVARAAAFEEEILFCEIAGSAVTGPVSAEPDPIGEVYEALRLGVRDYVRKNDFEKVVIGLSGGVDSALTTAIAVDAIGAANVVGVTMPSRFTSEGTRTDAIELARRLEIPLEEISIEEPFSAYLGALAPLFEGTEPGIAEENLQARVRGNYLMALSNKFGWLVLATGNKSEMAVGYSTLYGDLAGGFALIKDVPKTLVYELCEYRNGGVGDVGPIPQSIIDRPPSAELRPDQLDEDSLPPYSQLDPILEMYVEGDASAAEIVAAGHDPGTVRRVIQMVDRAEYKRRQAPPGVKITRKAFGRDRRLPITNRFVDRP